MFGIANSAVSQEFPPHVLLANESSKNAAMSVHAQGASELAEQKPAQHQSTKPSSWPSVQSHQ
jgi:hypothetical protein